MYVMTARAPSVGRGALEGFETLTLSAGELEASFAPRLGMAGVSLRHAGEELLDRQARRRAYAERGAVMGIPLLHPWANRLSGFEYAVDGRAVSSRWPAAGALRGAWPSDPRPAQRLIALAGALGRGGARPSPADSRACVRGPSRAARFPVPTHAQLRCRPPRRRPHGGDHADGTVRRAHRPPTRRAVVRAVADAVQTGRDSVIVARPRKRPRAFHEG
jgi:hypothetical protein